MTSYQDLSNATQAQASPCAGWYPNPHDDNSERWWDGTGWAANTQPLIHAPAEAPQPPVPAAAALPGADWYTDPQNPVEERWFDGAVWTQFTRQRAGQLPGGAPGLLGAPGLTGLLGRGLPGSISGQMKQVAGDPQGFYRGHRQGIDTAAGGALLVDGLVGLPTPNGNRGGVFKSLTGVFVGLVFVAVGFFTFASMRTPANMSATADGTVTIVHQSQGSSTSTRSGGRSGPTCTPVAGFVVDGKPYTATASGGVSPCPWTVGQPVTVAYDPASPASAMIPSKGFTQFLPGVGALVAVGGLFSVVRSVTELGAGGFLLMRAWRRRKAT